MAPRGTKAATAAAKDEAIAVEVPWEGSIHLDRVGEASWVLTHQATHERIRFNAFAAELSFEDDDAWLVTQEEGNACIAKSIDELFQKKLYIAESSGERFIVDTSGGGQVQYSLHDICIRYRKATVDASINHSGASFSFPVFVFRRPRFGFISMFWSCASMYEFLGLQVYDGVPSRWVWNQMNAWRKVCEQTWGATLVVQSNFVSKQTHRKHDAPFSDRCLPTPSLSTLGMLFFLARWAFLSREVGGLAIASARENAGRLLDAFYALVLVGEGSMDMHIVVADGWSPPWPRPEPSDREYVTIRLLPSGVLDVSALHSAAACRSRNSVIHKWSVAIKPHTRADGTLEVHHLVASQAGRRCSSLFKQFVHILATRAELRLGSQAKPSAGKVGKKCAVAMRFTWQDRPKERSDQGEVNLELASYVTEAKTQTDLPRNLSVAFDKGTPGGLGLYNSFFCTPANLGIFGVPQVEKTNDILKYDRPSMGGAALPTGHFASARQLAWLRRGRREKGEGSWRPIKIHRLAARRWCEALDGALRSSTGAPGLAHFTPTAGDDAWSPARWREWPHISVSMDLGSDGLSGSNGLLFSLGTNLTRVDDWSHGANCDVRVMLKSGGHWSYWLLQMVSFNVPFGPFQEQQRYQELRDFMAGVYETFTPESWPLFKGMAGELIGEMRRNDIELAGEGSVEQQAWDQLRAGSSFTRVGQRLCMSRFQDSVRGAEVNLCNWHRDLFERTLLCLEHDWLHTQKLEKLIIRPAAGDVVEEGAATTSTKLPTINDKVVRSAAQNAVTISVLLLSDSSNRRLSWAILMASATVKAWHGAQNQALRSADSAQRWLQEQLSDHQYLAHVEKTFLQLQSGEALERCEFIVSASACSRAPQTEAISEDDVADSFGQLVLAMVAARLRRGAFLFGWPLRMQKVLRGWSMASATVSEFHRDVQVWKALVARDWGHSAEQCIRQRHLLQMTVNRQLIAGHDELGYEPHPDITHIVDQQSRGVLATQIVEEMIGKQKNSSIVKCRKFRRPQSAMHSVLCSDLLGARHRYKTIAMCKPLPAKGYPLPPEAFQQRAAENSLPFEKLTGSSVATGWFSPSAATLNAPVGDLSLLAEVFAGPGFNVLQDVWLGMVCDVTHKMALRRKSGHGDKVDSGVWYIVLHHWPGGVVLAWPASAVQVCGSNAFYLEPHLKQQDLVHLAVYDWDLWDCAGFVWRSWLWQYQRFPAKWRCAVVPAIRPFMEPTTTIAKYAASCSFWNLSRTQVERIAKHLHVDLQDNTSTLQVLFDTTSAILGTDDQETLKRLAPRLAQLESQSRFSKEVMELDSAVEVLEHHDHSQVKEEQRHANDIVVARAAFGREFQHTLMEIKASSVPAKRRRTTNETRVVPTTLTQAQAKSYLPEGASIWRGWGRQEWCGHRPPFKRVSEPWSRSGEHEACRVVIRRLWEQHCIATGSGFEEIPVSGLPTTSGYVCMGACRATPRGGRFLLGLKAAAVAQ